ncbi:MAG: GAF domain-containing protein [Candidatus Nanopelagicales bacterium]
MTEGPPASEDHSFGPATSVTRTAEPEVAQEALLAAMVDIADGLELEETLHRIVTTASDLLDARFGALGVIGSETDVARFIHYGTEPGTAERIAQLPRGVGILGLLTSDPRPMRMHDLSSHPKSAGFPPGHPKMKSFLGVPITVRGEVFGNLYLTEKRSGDFTDGDQQLLETLARAAGVAIRNARLFERSERRQAWQQGVSAVDGMVLAELDSVEVSDEITRRAARLASAAVALLALPAGNGALKVTTVVIGGDVAHADMSYSVPHSRLTLEQQEAMEALAGLEGSAVPPESVTGRAFATGELIRTEDSLLEGDPSEVFGTSLALPLRARNRTLGVLGLRRLAGDLPFDDEVVQLADAFAAQTALALSYGAERRERDRLAVYEERDRIARDLHDLVIQRLFATGMMLEGAARLADLPPVLASRISAAVDELDGTIKEIRTTIFGLNEVGDGPTWVGPRARVLAEVERAAVGEGPKPSVTFEGPVDSVVDVERAGQLVAAVREGLSNALRHASCRRIEVQVAVTNALLRLAVLDDGIGVPAGEAPRVSGLANLDQRARALGGGCELRARSDAPGAELRWWVELG